ncbi:MAG: hypothetical protein AAGA26_01935 [Pseudomonadota bacterium]
MVRQYYCTYKDAGALRLNNDAKRHFQSNFPLFMSHAVVVYNRTLKSRDPRYHQPIERIVLLSVTLQNAEPKWIKLLEGTFHNDQPMIHVLSEIIAKVLVGHESDYVDKELVGNNANVCPQLEEFREEIWEHFEL